MGIYYSGLKVYNNLPPHIKDTSDDLKNFEAQLKQVLHYILFIHCRNIFIIDPSQGINYWPNLY
jgi:hypothetical protein